MVQQDSAIMADMVTDYFTNLFTAEPAVCADQVIDLIKARVTDNMNDGLCAEPSDKEIATRFSR